MVKRKSARLKKKKRVNYNEDNLWDRAVKAAKDTWQELIQGPKSTRRKKGTVTAKPPLFRAKPDFYSDRDDEKLSEVPHAEKPAFKKKYKKIELTKTPAQLPPMGEDIVNDEPNFPEPESAEERVKKITDADIKKEKNGRAIAEVARAGHG